MTESEDGDVAECPLAATRWSRCWQLATKCRGVCTHRTATAPDIWQVWFMQNPVPSKGPAHLRPFSHQEFLEDLENVQLPAMLLERFQSQVSTA